MMVTTEDVKRTARLCRLHIEDEELEPLASALSEVVSMFNELEEIDTSSVEPWVQPAVSREGLHFRVAMPTLDRDVALAAAPAQDGEYFVVPRVQ